MDRRSRRQNRAVRVRIGLWYPCEDLGEVEAGKEAALPATLTNHAATAVKPGRGEEMRREFEAIDVR